MKFLDNRFPGDIIDTSSILPQGVPSVAKLVPVNLSERAYFRIKKMISDYRFSPGSRLNVEQLARDLGTSRTPIWEAVRRLEQEGLVKNIPNRGVFLVELTHEAAIELYTVREVLEGMAARLAVERISDKALDKMEMKLRAQEKIVADGGPRRVLQVRLRFPRLHLRGLRQRDPSRDAGKHQGESPTV